MSSFQVESRCSRWPRSCMAPRRAQSAAAARAASSINSMVEAGPSRRRGSEFIFVLAITTIIALVEMGSARPLVVMANALASGVAEALSRWNTYMHRLPLPKAWLFRVRGWYEPLSELDLPEGVRFVAGFVHEDLSVEQLRGVHAMIERSVGREVDIAATCGLGRRPSPDQAWDAMDKTVALLTTPARKEASGRDDPHECRWASRPTPGAT